MNRIRELREDKDLRQLDVSKATGIDQRTLSNYETEKTSPDSYAIIKLAEFFDVSTDYLLGVSSKKSLTVEAMLKEIDNIQKELQHIRSRLKKL